MQPSSKRLIYNSCWKEKVLSNNGGRKHNLSVIKKDYSVTYNLFKTPIVRRLF